MAKPNYKGIIQLFEAADREKRPREEPKRVLRETIASDRSMLQGLDFGALWSEMYGWNNFHHCRSTGKMAWEVMEAAGPVTTASFQQITEQFVYGIVMDAYKSPEFIFTKLIPVRNTQFDFERIAGVTDIGDEVQVVKEGDNYPVAGPTETYRNAPVLRKRGFKVQLTREVIFFDRTGQLVQMASNGSKSMGQNREKRAIDCVIDENAGAASAVIGGHRYNYRGNSIASFGNSSGNHDWDNLSGTTTLVDWTDIEACEILLAAIDDPTTGEPITLGTKRHLVCATQNKLTALRIRNATEIVVVTPGYNTTGNPTETKVGNPYGGAFEVVSSPYYERRAATDTTWIYGDVEAACEYCQAWPEEVKTLAGGTQLEFDRDIVQQYRFSEYGNYSNKEPRALIQATVA